MPCKRRHYSLDPVKNQYTDISDAPEYGNAEQYTKYKNVSGKPVDATGKLVVPSGASDDVSALRAGSPAVPVSPVSVSPVLAQQNAASPQMGAGESYSDYASYSSPTQNTPEDMPYGGCFPVLVLVVEIFCLCLFLYVST